MLVRLSQCIAYCLERARGCREKADVSTSLTGQSDFSDLEDRWLRLVGSYEFSERLASGMNGQGTHKRNVGTILYRAGAVRCVRDGDAIACMNAVSSTGTEMPETPPRSRSTAVILPFPTDRVRKGRRGKISGFADRHLSRSSGSQLSRDIETTSLALIDYVALVLVVASVASGPLLVWFLLRTAH
jgi:hypothetical protein